MWRRGLGRDFQLYIMWCCLHGKRRPDLERLWLGTYFPVDKTMSRYRSHPFNRMIHVTDRYSESEQKTSEAYNALSTHVHAGNGISVRLV